jgi:hypothetical protein
MGLLLLAAPLAGACNESDSIVVVKVTTETGIASVFQLRALVSNAGDGTTRLFPAAPAAQPIPFETSFSLSLPRDRTGALDIVVEGLGSAGSVVANGAGTVNLHVGDNVAVTIALHAGASSCGDGQLDAGEGCDDGDRFSRGTCDYLCEPRTGGQGGNGGRGGAAGTGGVAGTAGTTGSAGTGGAAGAAGTGGGGAGGSGGRPCSIELLTSGGFDANNARWTQVTSIRALIYDRSAGGLPAFIPPPHSPTRLAWLGYDAHSMKPAIRQNITIPGDALQVNISGYYQIQSDEGACQCDKAYVELEVGGNATKLNEWSNENYNNNWAFFSAFVNGPSIAGQTVTLQVRADMDDGVNTSFYFDSLSVTADVCP